MAQLTKTRYQNLSIKNTLTVGEYFESEGNSKFRQNVEVFGKLKVYDTLEHVKVDETHIRSNILILNDGLNEHGTDTNRHSEIRIERFNKEPFKISYHNDNKLHMGISGELHMIPTIDTPVDLAIPIWKNGQLQTDTNIFIKNGNIYTVGHDGQHYNIDILFHPPPKLEISHTETTEDTITLYWKKPHQQKKLAFLPVEFPYIHCYEIDFEKGDTWEPVGTTTNTYFTVQQNGNYRVCAVNFAEFQREYIYFVNLSKTPPNKPDLPIVELIVENNITIKFNEIGDYSIDCSGTFLFTNTNYVTIDMPIHSGTKYNVSVKRIKNGLYSEPVHISYITPHIPSLGTIDFETKTFFNPKTQEVETKPYTIIHNSSISNLLLDKDKQLHAYCKEGNQEYILDGVISFTGATFVDPTFKLKKGKYVGFENVKIQNAVGEYKMKINQFPPSQNTYTIKYVLDGEILNEYEFVVDGLREKPNISDFKYSVIPTQIRKCHGIDCAETVSIKISFTINNIGTHFLPADKIVGYIRFNEEIFPIESTQTNTIFVEKIFDNFKPTGYGNFQTDVEIKPVNLLFQDEPYIKFDIKERIWIDHVSFTKWNDEYIFIYNEIKPHTIETPIIYNQALFTNGQYTTNPIYYKKYGDTGDIINDIKYKWIIKKFTSTTEAGTTQYKKIQGLEPYMLVYIYQEEVGWLDGNKEFNGDMSSLLKEGNGNYIIRQNTKHFIFKDRKGIYDFYLRIGIPIGNYTVDNVCLI
jgi:hypothetical protein